MKAKSAPESAGDEPDRIEGQPHPRETYDIAAQGDAIARASRAIRSGRPPQGWLLAGEPGIGKATLAYLIARYLLRHGATADGPPDLHVGREDLVSRQIEARGHPGLLVVRRSWDDKRSRWKTVITVDEIRKIGEFFGMKSASGGWRVALIDSADEMNPNAANALLKNLEEPPPRSLVILISHAPGKLLPTIRSRVQRLDLKPLDECTLDALLSRMAPELETEERKTLLRFAEGSLGLALRLAGEEGAQLAAAAESLLATGTSPDWSAAMKMAETVSRRSDNLEQFGGFLDQAISRRILAMARQRQSNDRAVETWEQLKALFARAVSVNLEPRQTVLSATGLIVSAKRHGLL